MKTRRLPVLNFNEILNFFLIKIHLIEIRSAQEVMSRYEILTWHPSVSLWLSPFEKVLNLSRTWLLWLSWMAQNLNILVFDPLAGPGKSISGFRSHPQRRHDLLLWSFSTAIQTKSIKMLIKHKIWCQMNICRDKVTHATHGSPLYMVHRNHSSIKTGLGILRNQNLRNLLHHGYNHG